MHQHRHPALRSKDKTNDLKRKQRGGFACVTSLGGDKDNLFFLGDPVRKGRTEKIGKNQLDSPHREVWGGISGNLIFFF
jgi:hypothetical protein